MDTSAPTAGNTRGASGEADAAPAVKRRNLGGLIIGVLPSFTDVDDTWYTYIGGLVEDAGLAQKQWNERLVVGGAPDWGKEDTISTWTRPASHKDYYTGELLDEDMYEAGKAKELGKMQEHDVIDVVPRQQSRGKKAVRGKIIAHKKWDPVNEIWIVRWRLVAMEFNNYERNDTFAGTPPVKMMRLLVSRSASICNRRGEHRRILAFYDACVAFFHASIDEELYLIPPRELCGLEECWLLKKALYGTRKASALWQGYVMEVFKRYEYTPVLVEPNVLHKEVVEDVDDGIDIGFHGDDFLVSTTPGRADQVDEMMLQNFDIKIMPRVGPGAQKQGSILKRTITWDETGYGWEGDPKHALNLIEWAKCETSTGAPTPGTKDSLRYCREAHDPVPPGEQSGHRSACGTSVYMSIDRPDTMFSTRVICRDMSSPQIRMTLCLKRLARYLVTHKRLKWLYPYQASPEYVDVEADSDWAGNEDDRKSTMCSCEFYGGHLIDFSVSSQETRALSSAEAEFYSQVNAAARGIHLRNLLRGLGTETKIRVWGDNTASQAMARRQGVGRIRHLEAKYLWIQEKVADKELGLHRVATADNRSDIGTKYVGQEVMMRHLKGLKLVFVADEDG